MRSSLLLGSAALATAACVNEADQAIPVATTSDSGVSRTPAVAEAARRSSGLVRFVQAVPDVSSVDVFADDHYTPGNSKPLFKDIDCMDDSGYAELEPMIGTGVVLVEDRFGGP